MRFVTRFADDDANTRVRLAPQQNSDHLEEKTAAQFARMMEHLERKKAETLEMIARERELKNKVSSAAKKSDEAIG